MRIVGNAHDTELSRTLNNDSFNVISGCTCSGPRSYNEGNGTVPTQEEVIPEQEDPQFSFKRQRRKQA
jgi:hypothetical protein